MVRRRTARNNSKNRNGISLRLLKKELRLIPNDIKREMRFLDLLFAEKNLVRTQAEGEVLRDFIDSAKQMVEFHQNRLERYQEFYDQLKSKKKALDLGLLLPEELQSLQKRPTQGEKPDYMVDRRGLRTGTDG